MELSLSSAAVFLLQLLTVSNVLLFLSVFLLAADYIKRRPPKNFPPGPFTWPLVGNLAQVDFKQPHISMCKFAEKYGDIFCVQMGSLKFVVLNGLQMVKDAFVHQGDVFEGRPRLPIFYSVFKEFARWTGGHMMRCRALDDKDSRTLRFVCRKALQHPQLLPELEYLNLLMVWLLLNMQARRFNMI